MVERLQDMGAWNAAAEALAIADALADVVSGRTVDGDVVLSWLESWGADHELPTPSAER